MRFLGGLFMNEEELLEVIQMGENSEVECKSAQGGLPKSLWETYSAFANTSGGIILLGVQEDAEGFHVSNIDVEKIQKDFWDTINDPQKVNVNILQNNDVQPIKIAGNSILKITVPRALRQQKPVSVNQNPYYGTYRRNFEGDYRCTKEEVDNMIAESSNMTKDSIVLPEYSLDDIDRDTLARYRQIFAVRKPDNDWNSLDDIEFLKRIGAWAKDRVNNREGLTAAGLLVFGVEMNILSYFPNYFLDYREKLNDIPGQRWSHRITSQDGNWSGNLFDFYQKVIKRINEDVEVPFVLEGDELSRNTDTRVHKALREALLNSVIHANYFGTGNIVVEKYKSVYKFTNPGLFRVPLKKAIEGGTSDARNRLIFKVFSQLGFGEQSGYGLESIHTTWRSQQWEMPSLIEEYIPECTILTLKTTSLIPTEVSTFLQEKLQDRYHQMTPSEIKILAKVFTEESVTNAKIQGLLNKNSLIVNKKLMDLVQEGALIQSGQGRWTEYSLGSIFKEVELEKTVERTIDSFSLHSELKLQIGDFNKRKRRPPKETMEVVLEICTDQFLTTQEISSILERDEKHFRKTIISPLVKDGKLQLRYPEMATHKKQAYKTAGGKS